VNLLNADVIFEILACGRLKGLGWTGRAEENVQKISQMYFCDIGVQGNSEVEFLLILITTPRLVQKTTCYVFHRPAVRRSFIFECLTELGDSKGPPNGIRSD
jgi:hypothetical protein